MAFYRRRSSFSRYGRRGGRNYSRGRSFRGRRSLGRGRSFGRGRQVRFVRSGYRF